jgi:hypothetical protein
MNDLINCEFVVADDATVQDARCYFFGIRLDSLFMYRLLSSPSPLFTCNPMDVHQLKRIVAADDASLNQ